MTGHPINRLNAGNCLPQLPFVTQRATLRSFQAARTAACIGSYTVTPLAMTAAPSNQPVQRFIPRRPGPFCAPVNHVSVYILNGSSKGRDWGASLRRGRRGGFVSRSGMPRVNDLRAAMQHCSSENPRAN
jgi:hypothetical protein